MSHALQIVAVCIAAMSIAAGAAFGADAAPAGGKKKIVFIHGPESHGFGGHAYGPAFRMLARMLNENVPQVEAVVMPEAKDLPALDTADAIVLGSDAGNLVKSLGNRLEPLMEKGVGLVCIHYTVDPTDKKAIERLIAWIGGAYVQNWSVNPSWEADFKSFPDHPVARGLKPFKLFDEWYYHMKFAEDKEDATGLPAVKGLTPILAAVPPESTRKGKDGPHSGNPEVRKRIGMQEVIGWAYERPNGGRGFGTTGMHEHWCWGQDSFRKCVLNAIVWTAKAEVPKDGVPSKAPTFEEMVKDLNQPLPKDFKVKAMEERLAKMNQ